MKKNSPNSQKGLTLIEVLVALSILAIGLLGVALMQVTSIGGGIFSREMATATQLSQEMLEKLRTLSYTDTALNGGAHPTTADVGRDLDGDGKPPFLAVGEGPQNIIDERGLGKDDAGSGPLIYTRTWEVADDTPAQNMKKITITVSWIEKGEGPVEARTHYVTITGVKVRE